MWLQLSDAWIRAGVSETGVSPRFFHFGCKLGLLGSRQLTSQAPLDLTELLHPVVLSTFQDVKHQSCKICENVGFRIHTTLFLPVSTGKGTQEANERGDEMDSASFIFFSFG